MIHYQGVDNVTMGAGKGYDIFPRTLRARLLLAISFVGGLGIATAWAVTFLVLVSYAISGLFELPPCSGSERESCLAAQTELAAIAQASCEGSERRVCFVPLGQVDPDLVRNLVKYYRDEYGLEIGLLSPAAIPAHMINPHRDQIDGEALADFVGTLFPADRDDPKVALIGLTPMDLYAHDRDWFFQMAFVNYSAQSRAVVSTYRMHLGIFRPVDDELVFSRARKLVTKYIGLMVYDLTLNDDPTSPMFGNILRVSDLDTMEEPLFGP